jgi:hypothetical protein
MSGAMWIRNQIDAIFVIATCSWIMAELVRVYHKLPISDAQAMVNRLVEYPSPVIWQDGEVKRILRRELNLADQVLVLAASKLAPSIENSSCVGQNITISRIS